MKNFQETKAEKFGRGNPWDSIQWNFLTVDDNFISTAIGNIYCHIRTCIHINLFFSLAVTVDFGDRFELQPENIMTARIETKVESFL